MYYVKDFGKKIVQSEKDFEEFVKSKWSEITLDISEESKLFKNQMKMVEREAMTLEAEYDH